MFIALAIVLLVISAILTVLSPKSVSIPETPSYTQTNLYDEVTTFQNIQYVGKDFSIAPAMMVATMTSSSLTFDSILTQFVNDFQLRALPIPPDTWNGPDYSLSKTAPLNYYNLTTNRPASSSAKAVRVNQATQTAASFLQKYLPSIQVQLVESKVNYFSDGYEPTRTTPENARVIFLPFSYQIDGTPVFYNNQREYPFEFVIDSDLHIRKFSFYPLFIQLQLLQKQKTISINQAVIHINQGKASLIGERSTNIGDISQITSAQLSEVSVEYRSDPQSKYVYPFYRFSGDATDANGQKIHVELITPAIQTISQ